MNWGKATVLCVGFLFACDDGEEGSSKVPAHTHDDALTNAMISTDGILGGSGCVDGTTRCEGTQIATCIDGEWQDPVDCPMAISGDECMYAMLWFGWFATCVNPCYSTEAAVDKTICHNGQIRTCYEHFHKPIIGNFFHYGDPVACTTGTCSAANGTEGSCQ